MKMKGTKCQKLEERIDFRKIKPGKKLKRNGGIEVITELNYTEPGIISRINTLKRNGEVIIELGYLIDSNGKLRESFAGRHYKKDTERDTLIHKASEHYSELNGILERGGL